jgi:hypothetical protein
MRLTTYVVNPDTNNEAASKVPDAFETAAGAEGDSTVLQHGNKSKGHWSCHVV